MTIAGLTFKALQDEVLTHQFSPTQYRDLVATWLNRGQRIAAIQAELRTQVASQAITTVAKDASYALSEDFGRIIDFFDSEHEEITPLTLEEFDPLASDAGGRPEAYTFQGNEILLYPTPDAAYKLTLRYWKLPQDMEVDEDQPEIPPQYHDLLVAYAMQKAYMRENDFGAAKVWEEAWEKGLQKMKGEAVYSSYDGPTQVEGSWGHSPSYPAINYP